MQKELIALMPGMGGGGAERVMSIILREAADNGYRVRLLLSDKSVKTDYALDERIEILRIPRQEGGKLSRKFHLIRFLRSYTKKNKSAVFLSFLTERNLDLLYAAPKGVRVVVSERNDPARTITNRKLAPLMNRLRNRLYRKASSVVFQTPDAMAYFAKVKGIRGVIIPNPVAADLPYHRRENNSKIIISVARLTSQKNYPMLMDAFDGVYKQHPDYQLHIWGQEGHEPGMAEYLKSYAQSLSCAGAIRFMGFSREAAERVAEAEIFVLSSDYEGMSNSMLEALTIGIPCVCTDCPIGGARMFIKSGANGLLVPVGDAKAMADAVNRMIEDRALRERCFMNADKLRGELDEKKIFKKWMEVFQNSL